MRKLWPAAVAAILGLSPSVSPGGSAAAAPVAHEHAAATCGDRGGGRTMQRHISSGGRERSYIVHLPQGYGSGRKWPVVLAFHGRGGSASAIQRFSGLDKLPAVVVYADGVEGAGRQQAWEGAPYAARGVDDVAFTRQLLNRLQRDYCTDERRVYATGKSNGAGFVGVLACEMADRIAAVAPVAPANYRRSRRGCVPWRPVPVVAFHGTADPTIPYWGDVARRLPPVPVWAAGWARRDQCRAQHRVRRVASDVLERRWVGCDDGSQVRLITILHGGHTWPGAEAYSGKGYVTHSIDASQVMWKFLEHFSLPAGS